MKIKKILSSALVAVMMFTMTVALLPMKAEAAHSPSLNTGNQLSVDEVKDIVLSTYEYEFESAEEMLNYELDHGYLDSVKSKSGKYSIYVNRYTGNVYYKNNVTGEILTSNPYDLSDVASNDTKAELISQIYLTYAPVSNTNDVKPYYSSTWAAQYAQIKVSPISNGLRVNYTIGDVSTRFNLPGRLLVEDFKEHIMRPMFKYFENLLEDYCRTAYPDASFDFYASDTYGNLPVFTQGKNGSMIFDVKAVRNYLDEMTELYSAVYPENSTEFKSLNAFKSNINLIMMKYGVQQAVIRNEEGNAIGVDVYTFSDNKISSKRQMANLLKNYCPDYTLQQIITDETNAGFVTVVEQKPAFRLALEYTFNEDDSLSVRLPANSITFDETKYALFDIGALMMFGAGNLLDEGYAFIPDGSGSIIKFDDFYVEGSTAQQIQFNLEFDMYGNDYCYSMLTPQRSHRESVTMPVFGINSTVNANAQIQAATGKEKTEIGYFAVVEEGASLTKLQAQFGGSAFNYGSAYPMFSPFPSDEYDLSDTLSVGGATSYKMVSESKYTGSYVIRYVMLSDPSVAAAAGAEFNPTGYIGMANYYRNYLEERGYITPLTEVQEDIPLYIEAFGSMDVIKRILTFPVTAAIPLTTFENVTEMYDELARAKQVLADKAKECEKLAAEAAEAENVTLQATYEKKAAKYMELSAKVENITNVNFKLTGFSNGGMYYTYPTKVKWEKSVGGSSGFKQLLVDVADRQAKGQNFNVYPDFDFQYINYTSMFDGISNKGNVSKMVDNRYASKQMYNSIKGEYEPMFAMVISADALDNLYNKFIAKISKYDVKTISVSTLGSDLNSNFDDENPINREEAAGYVMSLLDRMVNESGMSLMMSTGNIYSVKYAEHIIDIPTDSSHLNASSYAIPFVGLVLHGYVNYAGGALNYSGSPAYDTLRAIENGASLYYILSYQNTDFMKDDIVLNKYYGVSYQNWYDSMVESYTEVNNAIGKYQKYNIVDHKTVIAERVINDAEQEANFKTLREEFVAMVDSQLHEDIDDAFDSMFGDPANVGKGVRVTVDVDALIAQACDVLNLTEAELLATDFDEDLKAIKTRYENEYQGTPESFNVTFSAVEYESKYSYVTDSLATDKDYEYTDFTVDNDLVVMVTYKDSTTGHTVVFLLNYNIYSVTVNLGNGNVYELGKYGFVQIDVTGGSQNNG